MKHINNERGSALLIVVVVISLLLLSSTILLSTISKNNQYVSSQEKIYKSYYIAEAGIIEGIEYASNKAPSTDSTETSTELPLNNCSNNNGNGNKKCENKEVENTSSHSDGKGNAYGRCKGGGKSPIKNPHCKDQSNNNEEPTTETDTEDPNNEEYSIIGEENKPIFEENYKENGNVHWIVESSSTEDIFYITSTGMFRNAKTTLECAVRFNEEKKLEILYLIEI